MRDNIRLMAEKETTKSIMIKMAIVDIAYQLIFYERFRCFVPEIMLQLDRLYLLGSSNRPIIKYSCICMMMLDDIMGRININRIRQDFISIMILSIMIWTMAYGRKSLKKSSEVWKQLCFSYGMSNKEVKFIINRSSIIAREFRFLFH